MHTAGVAAVAEQGDSLQVQLLMIPDVVIFVGADCNLQCCQDR